MRTLHTAIAAPLRVGLTLCFMVCQPTLALANGSPLLQNELLEVRYADGVSKAVSAQWVRLAEALECGNQTHLVRTDSGEELCGSYIPEKLEFRPAAHASGVDQAIGKSGFDGYALPSNRTALLGYQVLSSSEGLQLNYNLIANQAPGVQVVASKSGSVAQGHMVFYSLQTETHGSNSSLSIRQWRAGQMVMDSGPLGAALGQGLEWRKSNSLSQNNVQVFNGRLVSETDLTVLVNNEARGVIPARPGDVSVFNVPLFEGNNEVQVIYRNEKGELVQTSRNVFFSQALLPQGKWLGSAGVYQDKRLRHWAAQAQVEKGVYEKLTLQGGVRVNIDPENSIPMVMANGEVSNLERVEAAVSARSFVAGGFLSAGFQSRTAYGPGINRVGYVRNSALFYAEKSIGPAKLGASVEPYQILQATPVPLPAGFKGVRVGFAKATDGPEYEFTFSKSFRVENMNGAFVSAYCKVGVDANGMDSNFCGLNANMALGISPFSSPYGPQPILGGISYSKAAVSGPSVQGQSSSSSESINGFVQTRDSYALVSKNLSFVRSRHDFKNVSVEGQYDSEGNLLAGVSGLVALDYGNKPRVMGFLPNDPSRPSDALVVIDDLTPAKDRGFPAVQTRINGVLSTSGLNPGAMVGQSNTILVNPESVSMESDMPALRLKLSPALPGIYKVGAAP
ncbi:MAG: hypothetical protein QE278_14440 [Limnobacter sp.]|nr:hypothetical protein [Limnobacter sp.]